MDALYIPTQGKVSSFGSESALRFFLRVRIGSRVHSQGLVSGPEASSSLGQGCVPDLESGLGLRLGFGLGTVSSINSSPKLGFDLRSRVPGQAKGRDSRSGPRAGLESIVGVRFGGSSYGMVSGLLSRVLGQASGLGSWIRFKLGLVTMF
ncbi:hypothetical protein HAX54_031593 [Datura stramonium]|uniref:Uncharacterized protein n=1 Tax=Datura stramonium TaxID=4076 RepID=A0ABS8RPL9_DATST|nr:hypothetical protein [Datura stramonium]